MSLKHRPLLVAVTLVSVLTATSGLLLAIAPAPLTVADCERATQPINKHPGTPSRTQLASAQ